MKFDYNLFLEKIKESLLYEDCSQSKTAIYYGIPRTRLGNVSKGYILLQDVKMKDIMAFLRLINNHFDMTLDDFLIEK